MDHPFTREEFAARIRAVQTRMAEEGIDVLLVAEPSNFYYLTGYNAWSFYTRRRCCSASIPTRRSGAAG